MTIADFTIASLIFSFVYNKAFPGGDDFLLKG